jgi:hypothetical protein
MFIKKILNNGYGDVGGVEIIEVSGEVVEKVWSGVDLEEIDGLIDSSGFNWNVVSVDEGIELKKELVEKGYVVREYEDCVLFLC